MWRVVVDNTVFTSAFINRHGHPYRVFSALQQGRFALITSEALLSELARTLSKPRITRKYPLTDPERAEYVAAIRELARVIPLPGVLTLGRDPHDTPVIETAFFGAANALVTSDKDLLECEEVAEFLTAGGVTLYRPDEFLRALDEAP